MTTPVKKKVPKDTKRHVISSVVGMQYHLKPEMRQHLVHSIPFEVTFRREHANPADSNAIGVLLAASLGGFPCGHIPRRVAAVIAPRLDAGDCVIKDGLVHSIDPAAGTAEMTFTLDRPGAEATL